MISLRKKMLHISNESAIEQVDQVEFHVAMEEFEERATEIQEELGSVADSESMIKNGEEIVAVAEQTPEATAGEAVLAEIGQRTVVEGLGYNADEIVQPALESNIGQQLSVEGFKEFLANVKGTVSSVLGGVYNKISGLFKSIFSAREAFKKRLVAIKAITGSVGTELTGEESLKGKASRYGLIAGKSGKDIISGLNQDLKSFENLLSGGLKLTTQNEEFLNVALDKTGAFKKKHNLSSAAFGVLFAIFITGPVLGLGLTTILSASIGDEKPENAAVLLLMSLIPILSIIPAVRGPSSIARETFGSFTDEQKKELESIYSQLVSQYSTVFKDTEALLKPFSKDETTYVISSSLNSVGHSITFSEPLKSNQLENLPTFKTGFVDAAGEKEITLSTLTLKELTPILDKASAVFDLVYNDLDKFSTTIQKSADNLKAFIKRAGKVAASEDGDKAENMAGLSRVISLQSAISAAVAYLGYSEVTTLDHVLNYVEDSAKQYGTKEKTTEA